VETGTSTITPGLTRPEKGRIAGLLTSHPKFAMIGWSTAKAAEGRRTPGR